MRKHGKTFKAFSIYNKSKCLNPKSNSYSNLLIIGTRKISLKPL